MAVNKSNLDPKGKVRQITINFIEVATDELSIRSCRPSSRLGQPMLPAFFSTNVFFGMIVVDGHIKHLR